MYIDNEKRGLERQIDSCEVDFENKVPVEPKDLPSSGSYKQHKEPKLEDASGDVFYKTECKIVESKVAIPTEDAVEKAKEWVDDINRK